jgi:hypothetical protein
MKIESEQKCFFISINSVASDSKKAGHSVECLQNKATKDKIEYL